MLDPRLASSTIGCKPSQLEGVLGSRIAAGLVVIIPPRRPIKLFSWLWPTPRVVKLIVDGCSKANLELSSGVYILYDHWCIVLTNSGSFLSHQLILCTNMMVVSASLKLFVQRGYSVHEVEFNSNIMVFWIQYLGYAHWDYTYILHRVCIMSSAFFVLVRHVLWE